jgi:hypothetical protein
MEDPFPPVKTAKYLQAVNIVNNDQGSSYRLELKLNDGAARVVAGDDDALPNVKAGSPNAKLDDGGFAFSQPLGVLVGAADTLSNTNPPSVGVVYHPLSLANARGLLVAPF